MPEGVLLLLPARDDVRFRCKYMAFISASTSIQVASLKLFSARRLVRGSCVSMRVARDHSAHRYFSLSEEC
jgi:hypothetical protein